MSKKTNLEAIVQNVRESDRNAYGRLGYAEPERGGNPGVMAARRQKAEEAGARLLRRVAGAR